MIRSDFYPHSVLMPSAVYRMCCDNPLLRLLYCPIAMVALCLDSSNRNYVKAAIRALFRALEKLDGKDSYRYRMLYDVMWLTIRCAVGSSYFGYQKKECHMLLESPSSILRLQWTPISTAAAMTTYQRTATASTASNMPSRTAAISRMTAPTGSACSRRTTTASIMHQSSTLFCLVLYINW